MTNVEAGFNIIPVSLFPNLLTNFQPTLPTIESVAPSFRLNWFVQGTIRYDIHNSTLSGTPFNDKSVYTISREDVVPVFINFQTGINIVLFNNIYMNYSLFGRGQEFEGGKKWHWWGGITLGYSPKKWYLNQ
ncbi:MAG: DUF2219 family protein [Bacteroidetes bacterium]|nr:DUF2219 family protein [Bacteroidota bacterium]